MKKVLVLLLAAAMIFTFAACAPSSSTPSATTGDVPAKTTEPTEPSESSKDKEIELSADGRYPKETVKMGFVNYDTTAEQVLAVQEYFKYLQTGLNFEVIWSESLNNAEEEFAFIEQCAAAGCKGIIGYYNEGNEESAKLCGNLNMYYWGLGGKPEAYELVKNEPYYIGCNASADNYQFGYSIAEMLVANDAGKIIVMSGGKDYGVPFFVDRYKGIMDGIAAAKADGKDIEVVYEVPGWPGTEEFAAHQTAALATDADGLAGTLTSLMWIQPMQVAGKFGQIKVATVDTVSNVVVDMMGAGMYVGVVAEIPEAFGMAVPMIINAVTGYGDQQRNSDGSAAQIEAGYWEINSVEEAGYLLSISNAEGGYAFSIDDVKTVLGAYNPDFTVEDMNALYTAVSVEEIQARKAAD